CRPFPTDALKEEDGGDGQPAGGGFEWLVSNANRPSSMAEENAASDYVLTLTRRVAVVPVPSVRGRFISECFRLKRQTRQAPKYSRRDRGSRVHRPPCDRWADRSSSDVAYQSARSER